MSERSAGGRERADGLPGGIAAPQGHSSPLSNSRAYAGPARLSRLKGGVDYDF